MSNNGQDKSVGGALNTAKWLFALLVVAAGVYGNNFYSNDFSVLERTLALLPLAAVALFAALTTVQGKAFARLFKESRTEIRRVVWPTQQETTQTTMMVLVVVLIMALILWGLDWILIQLVSLVIG